jgi:hypothetical protein
LQGELHAVTTGNGLRQPQPDGRFAADVVKAGDFTAGIAFLQRQQAGLIFATLAVEQGQAVAFLQAQHLNMTDNSIGQRQGLTCRKRCFDKNLGMAY